MLRGLIAFTFVCVIAAPAVARETSVRVRAGETVALHVTPDGVSVVERKTAGALTAFEASMLQQMQGVVAPPGAKLLPPIPVYDAPVNPPPIIPGQVQITYRKVPAPSGQNGGPHSLLTIENGYGSSFLYRATMHRGERSAPTDVCEVLPSKPGFEHWPYEIDWLELSDLELRLSVEGQVRCL